MGHSTEVHVPNVNGYGSDEREEGEDEVEGHLRIVDVELGHFSIIG